MVIAELYKILFPKVKNYIMKHQGRKEDASDVFQDAILYFYKQVMENTLNPKYTIYGYIYKLSINRWINKLKKDGRLVLSGNIQENFDDVTDESFKELERVTDNTRHINHLLSSIGEKCKELLTYTISYDLMIEDIMIRMNFPSEGAVKMQLKRCKEKLYKIVEENHETLKFLKKE